MVEEIRKRRDFGQKGRGKKENNPQMLGNDTFLNNTGIMKEIKMEVENILLLNHIGNAIYQTSWAMDTILYRGIFITLNVHIIEERLKHQLYQLPSQEIIKRPANKSI